MAYGRNDPAQQADDLLAGDDRAETRAGERICLRQRAQHDEVGELAEPLRQAGTAAEFHVGLIDDHDGLVGQFAAHAQHRVLSEQVAGGIVGRAKKHDLRLLAGGDDGSASSAKPVRSSGTSSTPAPWILRGYFVEAESGRSDDHVVLPGSAEGAHE